MRILSTLVVVGRRCLICALLAGLVSESAIAEVQLRFATQSRYPAGDHPWSIATGDFDGNGWQDIAVTNRYSNDVSILLGSGNGSFPPQTRYPAGYSPWSVAIGDFDRDGWQDLAVANSSSDDVSVMLGNGDGSFAPQTRHPAGDGPSSVAIGDFNGDGWQDLAVANATWLYGNDVSVMLGNGDGNFARHTRYTAGIVPRSVAIGDFDGDGLQDLAVGNWRSADVSVLLGNGDGSFAPQTRHPAGDYPVSVAIGDFDGDGRQDLAVGNTFSASVSIRLGNGDGSFAPPTGYPAGDGPSSAAIGDFDGDGRQDLAVTNRNSNDVSVMLGNGDGSFARHTRYTAGSQPRSVAVGDFDGDGWQDLAVVNDGSWPLYTADVSVLLNRSHLLLEIDMKPKSINPDERGVVRVAILGSEEFDVAEINVTSLHFGPNEAPCLHDLTDEFWYNTHLQDLNLDGYLDLMTHYNNQETGLPTDRGTKWCRDTVATLTGELLNGTRIGGSAPMNCLINLELQ